MSKHNPTNSPALKSASAPQPAKATAPLSEYKPTVDAVRARAYQLFLARSAKGQPGSADQDWITAERELRQQRA